MSDNLAELYPNGNPRLCTRCSRWESYDLTLEGGWCCSGRKANWLEYAPILRQQVEKHGDKFLERMDVPPAYRGCSFANFEASIPSLRTALESVKRWTRHGEGGLYLTGPVGVGKTHLAVAALRELRANSLYGDFKFQPVQELIARCRDSFHQEEGRREKPSVEKILDVLRRLRVLALDDFGAENSTEFSRETLGLLIDRAYRDRKSRLIITSNLDLQQLASKLDARIADRLLEVCLPIRIKAGSHRQKLAVERASKRGTTAESREATPAAAAPLDLLEDNQPQRVQEEPGVRYLKSPF